MRTMNIVVDMPTQPQFNVDKFKHRVQDFASMLVVLMSKETANGYEATQDMNMSEALSFIQSLSVKGGETVPADVNPMECFIDEKYEG